jgi:hypothetical protein
MEEQSCCSKTNGASLGQTASCLDLRGVFVVANAAMGLWDRYSVQLRVFVRCHSGESVLQQRYGKLGSTAYHKAF